MALLLIATNNTGKLEEMRSLLAGLPVRIAAPAEFGIYLDVLEDGTTYCQNASRKALAFRNACREIRDAANSSDAHTLDSAVILADDSGLEVEALNGAPGIHSARYAPQPGAQDGDRRSYLVQSLQPFPRPWKAGFTCTLAIIDLYQEKPEFVNGRCPGEIIPEERGSHGFGYDPVFLLPELGLTMAELSMEEKNRLSHRARAVMQARPLLEKALKING